MSRDRRCGHHAAETPLHACTAVRVPKYHSVRNVKKVFIVILIPKPFLKFRTGQAFETRPRHASKHVAAPGSINSKRITAKPAREGFVSMCACTEPVMTGIGAVCVEYGRPKWPITMLNHTHKTHTQTSLVQNNVWFFIFGTLCSYDPL